MSIATIQLPGYQVTKEVYSGSRAVVYRAIRHADQLPVAIKLLKRDHPSFSELVQFRNQYVIAKNLQIPGIIQPYTLDPYLNGYALVMEDFGGTALNQIANGKPLPINRFFLIALQLVDTLYQLHQQRVIHKDIKPANILIHPSTHQVKLIDFSIATLLPKETQQIQNLNTLEGTLAYLSPEQTGRMNRGIDYHSDLYSLGVTFFELLSGQLPFQSSDPMELIHCHLAKQPPQIHTLNPVIPPILSAIVNRLMAKNAEDRYQSALGLKYDLHHCLKQFTATGRIEPFELGQRDVSDRFLIPEKLYGREQEVRALLAAFERVAGMGNEELRMKNKGIENEELRMKNEKNSQFSIPNSQFKSELILVAGFSGIGKTAVINEIHKTVVRRRGYFIKGKFDQFQRNVPFSAFVQALRGLMGQLLSESDHHLERWKTKILDALGDNGQVMTEVIPELEQVIGRQPPVPELSGSAAQNRFNLLFQRFIQVFTTSEHPLVIFLDDLQWADLASLRLMQLLMSESGCGHLLLIGSYRDNEVSPAHPLMLALEEVGKASVAVNTITLTPLQPVHLNQLIADTLNCSAERSQPLTELVYQKTEGNPFFTNQFLRALHDDGLIQFNPEGGYWQCDIAQVRALSVPEDVAVFMAQRLQKLPSATQQVLKLAACIGNQFDLATLAIACEAGSAVVAANLWRALKEGLILPTNEIYKFYQEASSTPTSRSAHQADHSSLNPNACTYRFLHDRVQQAAYSLIPVDQKQATHLAIGQLLLRNTPAAKREEQIFEIVDQLNRGLNLVTQVSERENLAQLNLVASRRAKHATAYGAALDYANLGVSLLPQHCWQQCYSLSLALYELAVELAFLNGHFEQVEEQAQIVIQQAKTLLDQIKVYEVQIFARTSENRPLEAVEIGLNLLKTLGISLPDRPTDQDIRNVLSATAALHRDKDISDLANLPEMIDGQALAALQILNAIFSPCYAVAPNLLPLISATGAQLSMTHGNAPLSAFAYALYGMLLCGIVNDLESGYAFGQLALNLVSHFQGAAIETKVRNMVGAFILPWKTHLRDTLPVLQAAHQSGIETGDLHYQSWAYYHECKTAYLIGQELTGLEQKLSTYGQAVRQIKQEIPLDLSEMLRQVVLNLLGRSSNPCQLMGEAHNEELSRPQYQAANNTEALYFLNFHKFILCYWFGDSRQALTFSKLAERYLNSVPAQTVVPVFYFYDSLVRLSLCSTVSGSDDERFLDGIHTNQQKIEFWAIHASMNYQHKYELVEAEKCRVLGQRAEATDRYDRAIALARQNGFVQEEALANELAAKFYLDWGKVRIAQEYMTEAYYGYARWGAKAKITDLETRYSSLLAPILQHQEDTLTPDSALGAFSSQPFQHSTLPSGSSGSFALDLISVLKASQTLSSEIQLDKLLSILLKLVIENAGAEKGVFVLHENNQLYVEAVMQVGAAATVLQSIPLQNSLDVPANLIRTIKRMRRPLVVEDATVYPSLAQDAYIQRQQPKSLLCIPILHQGKVLGVLYLENNLTIGAFTSDRVEISNLLCAQAAISLANARLYQQAQTTLQTLQQSQQLLQLVMDTLPQRVFWKDRNFRYLGCNKRFAQDAGMQFPKQLIGKDDFELVWREFAHLYQEDDQSVLEQGMSRINYEERQMREDGSMVWLRTSKIPLRNKEGEIIGVFGCYEDITPLKEAEESLQKSEAELRRKSEELAQTVQDLQQAQLQLVQNEKMSALGSLVAGVAHEINNPVGFIAGNLQPAKDYINGLLRLVALYQTKFPNPGQEVESEIEAIDLEYVHDDLPKLLDSMKSGVDRIRNISTSLRIFSRADSDRPQPFDLHEGIDSTLLILKHRLRANETRPEIVIIKHYGELPLVECFAGQLNQVFMNLLANAIDALEESNQERSFANIEANPNQIAIRTEVVHSQPLPIFHSPLPTPHVIIHIRDNGIGIPEDIKHQIFDHLFTTKAIGKGTGLGLAIAHQIVVEKHRGTIHVDSTLGQGTEFVITIPVKAELRMKN